MNEPVAAAVAALGLLVAVWAGVQLLRNHLVDDALFYACAALEAVLLVVSVGGFIALARTSRPVDGVTFAAYLVTLVLVMPAAVLWGVSDKSRWGTGVLVIGGVVVAALMARLLQIWDTVA